MFGLERAWRTRVHLWHVLNPQHIIMFSLSVWRDGFPLPWKPLNTFGPKQHGSTRPEQWTVSPVDQVLPGIPEQCFKGLSKQRKNLYVSMGFLSRRLWDKYHLAWTLLVVLMEPFQGEKKSKSGAGAVAWSGKACILPPLA